MRDKNSPSGGVFESGLVIEGEGESVAIENELSLELENNTPPPAKKNNPPPARRQASANEESEFIAPDNLNKTKTGTEIAVQSGAAGSAKVRIGDHLVSMGVISKDQLNVALQEKKISGKLLGEVLVDLGFITADTLSTFLAETSGFEVFDPKQTIIDGQALALIDKETALRHKILPVSVEENELRIAMADPYDVVAMDTLRRFLPKGMGFQPLVTTAATLSDAIDAAYGYASSINDILKEIENKDERSLDLAGLTEEKAYTHPVVRLVNALIFEAVKMGASDLHFEPEENFVRLRYRVDGVLFTAQILHRQHWNAVSQRIKIMASLNIADKLSPQDGRIRMNVGGRDVDFRVSSLPTVNGENIVMRVLDRQSGIIELGKLGISKHNIVRLKRAQERPEGIIIVTGPTGSGKTTTLYSMLNEINSVDVNIQTLEDPVEYSLPMIRQTAVREGVLEFAEGIRAMLRQDPDVIFIGEIRDTLTAQMALQAAMTGHQVYTTLHTNDSFGALPRLYDLGMVPGMLAGNIICVMAQRLVRKLCDHCKEPYMPDDETCKSLGIEKQELFRVHQGGCDKCAGQGYKGRSPIIETLLFDEDLDGVVSSGGTRLQLKEAAREKGFKSLRDDGILKLTEGVTSLEALSRAVDIRA